MSLRLYRDGDDYIYCYALCINTHALGLIFINALEEMLMFSDT